MGGPSPQQVSVLAAVHVQARSVRLVIADLKSGSPAIRSMQTLDASDTTALAAAIDTAGVDLLIRVLPSSSTIVRAPGLTEGALPQGSTDEQLGGAIKLLAESELPATLPEFRRAAGMLPGSRDRTTVLLTAWPGTPPTDVTREPWVCRSVWVAEIAALAALARTAQSITAAAYSNAEGGSAAVLAFGQKKSVARVARLPNEAGDAMRASRSVLLESLHAAGEDASVVPTETSQDELVLLPRPAAGVKACGTALSGDALQHFGICVGAILLATDPNPSIRSLVSLHEREPRNRATLVERAIRALSSPARAAIVLLACLGLVLAAPLAVAYARLNTLEQRTKGDTNLTQRIEAGEKELALAKLLGERRWPMTKLMADVAGSAPVGVQLDSLELAQDAGSLTLRGVSDSSELITTLRENLTKTKVFSQVTTPSIGATAPGVGDGATSVSFQLSAKIAPGAATIATPPIDNFADRPLVARLYGDGAAPRRASSSNRGSSTSRTAKPAASSNRPSSAPSSSGTLGRMGSETKKAPTVPPALTDDQIAKLDKGQAMIEWAKRKSAAAQAGIDEKDKERLQSESEKAKRRMDELKEKESSSSSTSKGAGT